jgi:hypothetical protein
MVYGYNQKNPKAKFWKDDGLLKKQIKQKIVDIIDKKIKTKVFLGVRHENKDIIIAGRLTTKNDYKKSPIIIYSIGEIKNHNLEQKQFEQVKKEIKTIKKIKTAIFNTSDNRIMGKKLIIKLVFLDEIDFDYKKLSFNAYSVKNDKWVSKNKDTNQAKYNPKKILEEGRHIFALLEYFENQEVKKNKCACITGEIEERMESLKKELEGKLYKNTVKALLYEVVKNSKIYTSYLYYKTYCELRALSFGDYKKYLEIFE